MSRQQHWHSSLLPALFFSLLLHTALLSLWRQPLLPNNTALPSLQITLWATSKTQSHRNTTEQPQTATHRSTVSPVTVNRSKTPVSNPNAHNNTSKPAKGQTNETASAVQIQNIQRPDRRKRTRPQRKPPGWLPRLPQNITARAHNKPVKYVVKPTHTQKPEPTQITPRPATVKLWAPSVAIKSPSHEKAKARSNLQPLTVHSNPLTAQPTDRSKPTPATVQRASRTTRSNVTAIPVRQPAAIPEKATKPASKTQVLTWLNREIRKYFYYPGIARRRNLEGTVILRFQVEQNGRIADASIAQSSGAGILDRAALASLHKLGSVTLPLGENLDLTLPVIYRLKQRG